MYTDTLHFRILVNLYQDFLINFLIDYKQRRKKATFLFKLFMELDCSSLYCTLIEQIIMYIMYRFVYFFYFLLI